MTVEVYRVLTPFNDQLCGKFANMFKAIQYTRSRPNDAFIYREGAGADTAQDAMPDSIRGRVPE